MKVFTAAFALIFCIAIAKAEPVALRIVAANLTSGNFQSYSPDNGNHSNPEGAGARILKALRPDVVLIQEFNTTIPVRQWVNETFGNEFSFAKESGEGVSNGIPNGIVSRYKIVESGVWDDVSQINREFLWAKIALPNGKFLWAISVHLYSKKPEIRNAEAAALLSYVNEHIPKEDLVVLGGDFNTKTREEPCILTLKSVFVVPKNFPIDSLGNENTNANRNKPYDWVLPDRDLENYAAPVYFAKSVYWDGMVFDSRVSEDLSQASPVQKEDSQAPNMQHMAVIRDFLIP